jgi:hypothetical protein
LFKLCSQVFDGPNGAGYPPHTGEAARHERAPGHLPGAGSIPAWSPQNSALPLVHRVFRRAVESGLSEQRETASGFKSRPSRQMAGFPTRLLSVASTVIGPNVAGYLTQRQSSGLVPELQVRFLCPTSASCPILFSTGRRIGLSPHKREVAGSSPASGNQRRSSSEVERVTSQFVSYPSPFQRAVDRGFSWTRQRRCNSAPRNIPRWCNYSTPGNSTVALLPAIHTPGRADLPVGQDAQQRVPNSVQSYNAQELQGGTLS